MQLITALVIPIVNPKQCPYCRQYLFTVQTEGKIVDVCERCDASIEEVRKYKHIQTMPDFFLNRYFRTGGV